MKEEYYFNRFNIKLADSFHSGVGFYMWGIETYLRIRTVPVYAMSVMSAQYCHGRYVDCRRRNFPKYFCYR